MRLTEEQIQVLYQFTEKNLVHWYDLQIELVDTLASKIEEEMEKDPTLNFESALNHAYKSFGLFGFAEIVREKQNALEVSARKIWWQELKCFFRIPQVMLLGLIAFVMWQLTQFFEVELLGLIFVITYIAASIVLLVYVFKKVKTKRKLLMLQSGHIYNSIFVFLYDINLIAYYDRLNAIQFCILASLGILFTITSFKVFYGVREKAKQMYPNAFAR